MGYIDQHISEMTEWYCHLVKQPGWKEYVTDRVSYMAAKQPALYRALEAAVDAQIAGMTAASEPSPASSSNRGPANETRRQG